VFLHSQFRTAVGTLPTRPAAASMKQIGQKICFALSDAEKNYCCNEKAARQQAASSFKGE